MHKNIRIRFAAAAFAIAMAFSSCASYKDILYFQDIDQTQLSQLTTEYEAVIKKDDRLSIIVSGPDKLVCAPYNLTMGEMGTTSSSVNPENASLTYLVDSDGCISFPILGQIKVEGMTRQQLTNYLTEQIGRDVKDPVVSVSFKNYKITVLGEVRTPGTYVMDSEKNNILQALGRAGDLNLTAKRDGILLIREVDGTMVHYTIDLKSSQLLDSPYFFLQQNDVIYVPANASRVATANNALSIWSVMLSSITTSLAILTTS
ncbi:MAG: polysaccharide biosynthesis/export family protein [Bacteroidales bacterium]|nr:polysaccharide biosynthesis/export family protein [Bacteroidales bacterium]